MILFFLVFGGLIGACVVVDAIVRNNEEAQLQRRIHGDVARSLRRASPTPLLEAMRGIPEPPAPGTPVNLTQVMSDLHNAHVVSGECLRLASKGERCCAVEIVSFIDHEDGVRPILRPEVNTGRKKRWKP